MKIFHRILPVRCLCGDLEPLPPYKNDQTIWLSLLAGRMPDEIFKDGTDLNCGLLRNLSQNVLRTPNAYRGCC